MSIPLTTHSTHLSMLWWKLLVCTGAVSAWSIQKGGVAVTGHGDSGERDSFESLLGPVEFFSDRSLDISFRIPETPKPHQVTLRVFAAGNDQGGVPLDKLWVAKMKGNTAKVLVPFDSIPEELHNHELDVNVLISSLDGNAHEEKLFTCIAYGQNDTHVDDIFLKTGTGSDLVAKPQIFHQFAAPPRQVKSFFALTFVAANLALFAALVFTFYRAIVVKQLHEFFHSWRFATWITLVLVEGAIGDYHVASSIFSVLTKLAILIPILLFFATRPDKPIFGISL